MVNFLIRNKLLACTVYKDRAKLILTYRIDNVLLSCDVNAMSRHNTVCLLVIVATNYWSADVMVPKRLNTLAVIH